MVTGDLTAGHFSAYFVYIKVVTSKQELRKKFFSIFTKDAELIFSCISFLCRKNLICRRLSTNKIASCAIHLYPQYISDK